MKSKKAAAILTIILFSFSVCACSSNQEERMTESVSEESATEESESSTEEMETSKDTETKKETETSKETQKETESTKESKDNKAESETAESKDNKVSESSKTSTPKEDSKPVETTAPRATEVPKETAPVHTHKYVSSVSQAATCSVPGILSYTCSCGDSYTESIPCIDHAWQDRYETIHHEAQGEMRQVQTGTTGDVWICKVCGAEFSSDAAHVDHCRSFVGVDREHATATYFIRSGEQTYTNEWVVTQEAYDETIVVGQICVNCSLTR